MNKVTSVLKPLGSKQQRAILDIVLDACKISERDKSDELLCAAAKRLIKYACWRWTVDAVDSKTGKLKKDAYKSKSETHRREILRYLPHTTQAAQYLCRAKKCITYDHVVPIKMLCERILELGSRNRKSIWRLLNKHCIVAIITKKENKSLNHKGYKQKMPGGWKWTDSPFARYEACRIKVQ